MQLRYPLLKKWTADEHEMLKAMAEAAQTKLLQHSAVAKQPYVSELGQYSIPLRLITTKRK